MNGLLDSLLRKERELKAEVESLRQQLANHEAKNVVLREEFQAFVDSHEECLDFDGFTAHIVGMDDYHSAVGALEAVSSDTSALAAYVAKAGEKMRQKAAKQCNDLVLDHPGRADLTTDQCADGIRALPGVTLDDLKGSA